MFKSSPAIPSLLRNWTRIRQKHESHVATDDCFYTQKVWVRADAYLVVYPVWMEELLQILLSKTLMQGIIPE